MPAHNAGKTLPAAIQSIRRQGFVDWELVVVDDGSQDETAAMIASAARGDRRIRGLPSVARGITEALRRGCAAARGEFIARMDADDVMAPDRLEQQLMFAEAHPEIGVVSCRVRYGGDRRAQAGYAAHVDWTNSLVTSDEIDLRRFVESPLVHPSVMFRSFLLGLHGGYAEGDFPEDYELWLRWMDAGVRFAKVDEELLTWNDSPNRLSRRDHRYRIDAFYRVKCIYLARWLKRSVAAARGIWLWGGGRVTRRRFRSLETEGIPIVGYLDVDERKLGRLPDGREVISHRDLTPGSNKFILAGVAARGARGLIGAKLNACGFKEGSDFLLVA